LFHALKDGSYNGGWVIPPYALLIGTEPDEGKGVRERKIVQPDNLFDHKNTGVFSGSFKTTVAAAGFLNPLWYWSSTANNELSVRVVRFQDGYEGSSLKSEFPISCRPVRLVEA